MGQLWEVREGGARPVFVEPPCVSALAFELARGPWIGTRRNAPVDSTPTVQRMAHAIGRIRNGYPKRMLLALYASATPMDARELQREIKAPGKGGVYYAARELVDRGLVEESGDPRRYVITETGTMIAREIVGR